MEREAKAKVVSSVLGAEFIRFLAALAILPLNSISVAEPEPHGSASVYAILSTYFIEYIYGIKYLNLS